MFKKIKEKSKNLLILGRYNNPAGAFLLMWPCFWGVISYADKNNIIFDLLCFCLGSFVMRGAGCCLNDILDKDFDSKVKRTKNRPLASGKIGLGEAILFLILQLFLGFCIVIQFEKIVIFWSFLIIPFVFCYPLFKRISNFPQLVLGLVFNWGVIVGHLSQSKSFQFEIFYLYFGGVLLTTAYDTIYGYQDIDDDKKLGLKSLAILLENKDYFIFLIYFLSSILFSIFFFQKFSNNLLSFLGTSIVLFSFLFQYYSFKRGNSLNKIFRSNVFYGALITLIIASHNYF